MHKIDEDMMINRGLLGSLAASAPTMQPAPAPAPKKVVACRTVSATFTPFQARQYWKGLQKEWQQMKDKFDSDVTNIENCEVRMATEHLLRDLWEEKAIFIGVAHREGYIIEEIALGGDSTHTDKLLEVGMDAKFIDLAFDWIIKRIQRTCAPWTVWAIGAIEVEEGRGRGPEGTVCEYMRWKNVVYSIAEQRLIGIETQPHPQHKKYQIIEVDFYGKRKSDRKHRASC